MLIYSVQNDYGEKHAENVHKLTLKKNIMLLGSVEWFFVYKRNKSSTTQNVYVNFA